MSKHKKKKTKKHSPPKPNNKITPKNITAAATKIPDTAMSDINSKKDVTVSAKEVPTEVKLQKKNKKILFICIVFFAFLSIIVSISAYLFIDKYTRPLEIGVTERPSFSYIENKPFVSALCKIDHDISSIDTTKCGKIDIPITFFGIFKKKITLNIIDNLPPVIETRNVYISSGKAYDTEMFIASYFDHSDVSFELLNAPTDTNNVGQFTVCISAADSCGNSSETYADLYITDSDESLIFEYGVAEKEILNAVNRLLSDYTSVNIPQINGCGYFEITAYNNNSYYISDIVIKDTTPPEAWVRSFDIPLGKSLTQDDIVCDIKDQTDVKIDIPNMPSFDDPGEYLLKIVLTDEFGNTSTYQSTIRIHDINTVVLADEFTSIDEILALVFKDDFSKACLEFNTDLPYSSLKTGTNTYELVGEFNKIKITAYVDDGMPPYFHVNDIRKALNAPIHPEDFVSYYYDATKIIFSFEEPVSTSEEGVFSVGIIATDKAGHSSVEYALLTVFEDTRPPKIYGVQDIYLALGQSSPNYLSGITSLDNVTEDIKVTVDASKVDLSKEGSYTIVYRAVDEAGNVTEAEAVVNVTKKVKVRLNVMNILQNPNLPNGCEVVSLCIVLNYLGYQIDPLTLYYDYMPQQDLFEGNPWYYYIGNATDVGFGCYAPCVVTTGNDYIEDEKGIHKVYDVSGKELSEYEKYLDEGTPVIMWGLARMNGDDKRVWDDIYDGEEVVWHSYSHCLVMIGYTETGYIFCDPLVGVTEYSKEDVEKCFEINFRQACIVK